MEGWRKWYMAICDSLLFFSLKYVATISLCSEHGDTEDNITLCLCVSVFKKLIIK